MPLERQAVDGRLVEPSVDAAVFEVGGGGAARPSAKLAAARPTDGLSTSSALREPGNERRTCAGGIGVGGENV